MIKKDYSRTKNNEVPRDFAGADLTSAKFCHKDLTGVDFTGANLTDANFTGANLTDANFTGATIFNTSFTRCKGRNLTGAIAGTISSPYENHFPILWDEEDRKVFSL